MRSLRTPILRVPSVASQGEFNVLINQSHPDFHRLSASAPRGLAWDRRLFADAAH